MMNKEEFMSQKAGEMSIKELAEAIKIKTKESKLTAEDLKELGKDPNVFEDWNYRIEIVNTGNSINITHQNSKEYFSFYESLPLLEKAVERAKELRGEK